MAVFRPDLYDAALGLRRAAQGAAFDPVRAFAGPTFDAADVRGYLAWFNRRTGTKSKN